MKIILNLFFIVIAVNSAVACDCVGQSFDEEARESRLIFHGKVISVEGYRHSILVITNWKGTFEGDTVQLTQGQTSCEGRTFALGTEYVFFLNGNAVRNCSSTDEYKLSVDVELLDLMFKSIGDKGMIESDSLTPWEFQVIQTVLTRIKTPYPANLETKSLIYLAERDKIKKLEFLNSLVKWPRIIIWESKRNKNSLVLWTGYKYGYKSTYKWLKRKF